MKASSRKWVIGLPLLLAVAGVGGFSFYNSAKKVDYLTAKIERGEIDSVISSTGTVNAVINVQVGSQVSGNIVELHADWNSHVHKGDLVAVIDPVPFQAKVDQAKAAIESAKASVVNGKASLKKADADIANAFANVKNQEANIVKAKSAVSDAKVKLDRRVLMKKDGIIAQEDLDTAQATYDQAVAAEAAAEAQLAAAQDSLESAKAQREVVQTQLDSAEAQVKQAEANEVQAELDLLHTKIISPVDGFVVARNMDVGQTVAASFSAPTIFNIAKDLTKMQVDANIDESDIGRVKVDQPVTFTVDAFPGQTFTGAVTQIRENATNVQNVITYDVVIKFDNSDLKLFPGMTANVRILTDRQPDVLKLPNAALRFRPADAPPNADKGKGGGDKKGGSGGFGQGGQGKGRGQGGFQTVYALGEDGKPKAVRVRVGSGDGNFVALLSDNLKEGDSVITGIQLPAKSGTGGFPGQQQQNFNQFKAAKGF
ncbi:MAG TPA: efflux RND transporter periplasmic adaptor subunit [Bryobacteraceae bacterium]|nr:efflux RND transporter periplasmic adaptor subunit [Bryobacteraceae bacterium]